MQFNIFIEGPVLKFVRLFLARLQFLPCMQDALYEWRKVESDHYRHKRMEQKYGRRYDLQFYLPLKGMRKEKA